MKTVLKVAGGVVLGIIVLIIAVVVLIGLAADEVQDESDKTAITLAQYQSLELGTERAVVVKRFGTPSDIQETEAEYEGIDVSNSCIYYNLEGELLSLFQFCFDENKQLNSKNRY